LRAEEDLTSRGELVEQQMAELRAVEGSNITLFGKSIDPRLVDAGSSTEKPSTLVDRRGIHAD
jgi:hypothetical protein